MGWADANIYADEDGFQPREPVPSGEIPAGQRNATLARIAGALRRHGNSEEVILAALRARNGEQAAANRLPDGELVAIAASIGKKPPESPPVVIAATNSTRLTIAPEQPWPEALGEAAYHGPLGAMVHAVEDYTEADPVGILGTLLTDVACVLGDARTIHQGAWHAPRLFTVLVGDTAFGRKGTATAIGRDILRLIEPEYWRLLVAGLGSGEGLVNRLRRLAADGGTEHRALVTDAEFGRLLAVMGREGSTLSPILRDAWDGAPLGRTLARQDDLIHEHHVGLLAHITPRELRARLDSVERDNGFANRFVWLMVRRQRLVPFPQPPDKLVQGLWPPVARAIAHARTPQAMTWTPDAASVWEQFYTEQAERRYSGMLGAISARAEAQVTRLALVYALVDAEDAVDVPHLDAAREVWRYAVDSARYIFGDSTGNRHADVLLGWLASGEVAWSEAKRELGMRTAADMQEVVNVLVSAGLAELGEQPRAGAPGRPVRVIRPNNAKGAKDAGGTQQRERESDA